MRLPIFCIGTSAGGVSALQEILSALPKGFPNPIVVTQHLPQDAKIDLPLVFGRQYSGDIVEVQDKTGIADRTIFFAPPNYHLLFENDFSFSLSQDEAHLFARPSIDVFFESAAWALEEKCCAILLTGANGDGARGLLQVHECGGTTIVQDPMTAESRAMPQAALDLFKPTRVSDLVGVARLMTELSEGRGLDAEK